MISRHGYSCLCENTVVIPEPPESHYPRYSHSGQHSTPSTRTFPRTTERRREGQNEILRTTERLPEFLSKTCRRVRRRWDIRKEKTGSESFVVTKAEMTEFCNPWQCHIQGKIEINKKKKQKLIFAEQKKEPKSQKERWRKRKMRKSWWKGSGEDGELFCSFFISKNYGRALGPSMSSPSAAPSALTSKDD